MGLVTDFDGTVSPIVRDPYGAQVTARSRELLRALGAALPLVAVVSGRSAADIQQRVGLPGLVYVGNHGLERWVDGQVEVHPQAAGYRPALEAAIHELEPIKPPGMIIEDKGVTLSVHYRQADDPDAIGAAYRPRVRDLAARLGLTFFEGRPPVAVDKGIAFRRLVTEHDLGSALYIGDDLTDVDAFRAAHDLRRSGACYALAAGVESGGAPDAVRETADVLVSGVPGVEALLSWLLDARSASST
jgi:trehalose 6-phosphate phosphatase